MFLVWLRPSSATMAAIGHFCPQIRPFWPIQPQLWPLLPLLTMLATTLAKSRKTPTTMASNKEQCSDIPSLPLTPTIYNHSTNSGHSTYSGNSTYSGRVRPFPRLRLFCWFQCIWLFDQFQWLWTCMGIPRLRPFGLFSQHWQYPAIHQLQPFCRFYQFRLFLGMATLNKHLVC